jgi:uncharacterized protein (UPF0248 family)
MGALKALIESIGLLKACRIEVQHGINCGTLLVVSMDTIQILLNQIVASESTRLHRLVNVRDGSFDQMERAIWGAVSARHQQKSKHKCDVFYAYQFNSLINA